MASIDCNFFSETLGMASRMRVLLPEPPAGAASRAPHPVLWLLHGLSDDETAWARFSGIERYVQALDLAVVMPNVHRSYYSNMAHGYRYWDFISEELPNKARALFPLSARRELNFVAGLSMGGYGALKLALSKPESFAAAASLSASCDLKNLRLRPEELALVFGDVAGIRKSGGDLQELARTLASSRGPKPKLFQSCGTEDAMLPGNRDLRDFIAPLGFDYLYEEGPGAHDWPYWDAGIQRILHWLPLP
ncbi:MAG TPA: alpha/beta hydrolase-fold protein [Polyangiaceae bacterium]